MLTNNHKKWIRNNYKKLSPEKISKHLNVKIEDVKEFIKTIGEKRTIGKIDSKYTSGFFLHFFLPFGGFNGKKIH